MNNAQAIEILDALCGPGTGPEYAAVKAWSLLRPVIAEPNGWIFYFTDDNHTPHVALCATRDDVYAEVAEWMTGERDEQCISDHGNDMVEGVTATLIESGSFHPEGEPPCYLRAVLA